MAKESNIIKILWQKMVDNISPLILTVYCEYFVKFCAIFVFTHRFSSNSISSYWRKLFLNSLCKSSTWQPSIYFHNLLNFHGIFISKLNFSMLFLYLNKFGNLRRGIPCRSFILSQLLKWTEHKMRLFKKWYKSNTYYVNAIISM